jgi:hypothetical protein
MEPGEVFRVHLVHDNHDDEVDVGTAGSAGMRRTRYWPSPKQGERGAAGEQMFEHGGT